VKLHQNRAGQWNVETMLAALRILAGRVDCGLFIEISFARQREDSLRRIRGTLPGVDMNGDRLRTSLLACPTSDVLAAGGNEDAINVADDPARARFLAGSPRRD